MKIIPIEKYKMFSGRNVSINVNKQPESRLKNLKKNKTLQVLLGVYFLFWVLMSIKTTDRSTWVLENMLLVLAIIILIIIYKWFRFSNKSYVLISLFFALHIIGAKYTYTTIPVHFLNSNRYDYDRLVHFTYGLLLMFPYMEFSRMLLKVKGFRCMIVAGLIIIASSAMYEIYEMWVGKILSPDLGLFFLGSQGDQWDSIKDMQMSFIGMVIFCTYFIIKIKIKEYKFYKKD